MPHPTSTSGAARLAAVLAPDHINRLGRDTGFAVRLRTLTPIRMVLALLSGLAGGRIAHIADLLRELNQQQRSRTRYKPFYNRLARAAFPRFLSRLVTEMLTQLCQRLLSPVAFELLSRFTDIVLQDGSSFHVHPETPRSAFGGMSQNTPAARLHVTMSALDDAPQRVVLTGNSIGETRCRLDPAALAGKLFLADRAYACKAYFRELLLAGASFIIRLSKTFNPPVVAIHDPSGRIPLPRKTRPPLNQFIAQLTDKSADVDVDLGSPDQPLILRIVVFPGKDPSGTRLCTNRSPAELPAQIVGDAYRLRWQIELLFKEWKSFTNLHRWQTQNPHILEGLIWASLAAAILARFVTGLAQTRDRVVLSTQAAAKSAACWLRGFLTTIARNSAAAGRALRTALDFLAGNVARLNLPRDRKSGRFRSLAPAFTPLRDH